MTVENSSAFELGQQRLKLGDAAGAVQHLRDAEKGPNGLTLEGHLLMAEALWQQAGPSGTDEALPHYEAAQTLAREAQDPSKESMVCLGHGFALLQLGNASSAHAQLSRAHQLSEASGNAPAANFVAGLLKQCEDATSPEDRARAAWDLFAKAYTADLKPILFMRPGDEKSASGVSKLKAAGAKGIMLFDVSRSSDDVPDGLPTLSDGAVVFPQLFLKGACVEEWMEMPTDELRKLLSDNGVELGEPQKEDCHGVFSEGLAPWEVALVELVSKSGASDWKEKCATLREREFGDAPATAEELEEAWGRLAPLVRSKLEEQPEMPCGHSCNTCPTQHDCQLHDAVGHTRDIEDLA
eukprot:TRINITY_DN65697_c0_g1_i1.p1 TRINITY_DN65697_c0_g1~~TRINITY_DN65697_c0_g1_i1.p1  ORF type:complete len:353 (+),score=59.59 TRINITY_DN65697_c0_g1_i1:79-1137(+)